MAKKEISEPRCLQSDAVLLECLCDGGGALNRVVSIITRRGKGKRWRYGEA
jgi:hypothetical protein